MKCLNNRRGFTLIELLVYMAIVGIVVVIAGQVYSDSTKMRVRTQNMLAAGEMAENAANLIRDDLAQMGAKSKKGTDDYEMLKDVMMKPDDATNVPDSSSFVYTLRKTATGKYADVISFRRAFYENGTFKRIEQVSWYLENGTLFRSCRTVSGTEDEAICPADNDDQELAEVAIATGVTNFMLTPARPSNLDLGSGDVSIDGLMFPEANEGFKLLSRGGSDFFVRANSVANLSGKNVTLSGFTSNYQPNGTVPANPTKHQFFLAAEDAEVDNWNYCKELSFEKGKEYEISFYMGGVTDMSRMFRPDIDHMAVGIRKKDDSAPDPYVSVKDYLFYPPESDAGSGIRTMRFSVNEPGTGPFTGCVAFTFAFYSPTVSTGSFVISNVKVRKVVDSDYTFVDEYQPNVYDRKNVRAFRLKLDVVKGRENGHTEMIIPVPSNGTRG
ncbi:MAG: prepilin-type N-terminal cleavage/methylation domain-containing protein [Fibrobacter sp.]|nr:prepilin-type N-terminal cleavage/methylation domain-containing protein [Fibrobacter sp.]